MRLGACGPCHLLLPVVSLALASASGAATFTVTTTDDMGAGSLRQAILDANASGDVIDFDLPDASTITLVSDLPDLADGVTIDPSGASGLVLDGAGFEMPSTDLDVVGVDVGFVDLNVGAGDIRLGDNNTLTLTANNDFEVGADISDFVPMTMMPGTLVKDGDGALTLSGDNTAFGGLLEIDAGKVIGTVTSLPAKGIIDNGALVFNKNGTYGGVVTGTGTVEKTGSGTLTLTGANLYTGKTTVSQGTLAVDTTSLPANPVEIKQNAFLMFQGQDGMDVSFGGDISGAGGLIKSDTSNLTLEGSNSYGGGTAIEGGRLIGDTGSIPGDVDISSGATLVFEQAANTAGTHSGAIKGDGGAVEKIGMGSVHLTGSNTYTGGTTVTAGELVVDTSSLPGDATIEDGAKLAFDQGTSGPYDGVLSGAGALEKRGTGVLTLSADLSSTLTGPTMITGGTLDLTGSLANVTVDSGGTLSGTGTVKGAADVRGTVSVGPAGGAQKLTVEGDLSFEPSSRFVVRANDVESTDVPLDAQGNVDVQTDPQSGAKPSLVLDVAPGTYSNVSVRVLQYGSLPNDFPNPPNRVFLTIAPDACPGDAVVANTLTFCLNGNLSDIAGEAMTPNQRAVGAALDTFNPDDPNLDPDVHTLFENLITVETPEQLGAALDALSGESISAFTTARVALDERMQRALHRRMRSVLFASEKSWPSPGATSATPGRAPVSGPTDVAAPPRPGERGLGTWLDGYGILGTLDGDGNAATLDYRLYGTTAGFDARLGDHGLAGLAVGYARTDVDLRRREDSGNANTVQGALYAAYATPLVYAGLSGRYAWSRSESTRSIAIGDLGSRARADFDSHDFGLRGELDVNAFEVHDVRFQPLAAFQWSHLSRQGFQERGAGSLSLDVASETLDTSLLQLGARVTGLFPVGEQAVLVPELRAFWLNEFGDRARRVEARIAGAPFTVRGAEAPRSGALVGAGWTVSLGRDVQAAADYDLRLDADRLEHTGTLSLRVRF